MDDHTTGNAKNSLVDSLQGSVAISGGSGLVGSALTLRLKQSGVEVFHLVRGESSERSVPTIAWDPQTGIQETDKLASVVAVVHLAGRSIGSARWTAKEKAMIRGSRVDATRVLAEQLTTLKQPKLRTFVSASATGIYGECGDREIREDARANPTTFLSEVASQWEAAAKPAEESLRVVHPRLGIVMSSDGGALSKVLPLFRSFLGGKLGNGSQYWSWVSIDDCVEAIVWMLTNDKASGSYNVTAPNPTTNLEFTQTLARVLGRPALVPAPAPMLRLALGEMADELLLQSCRAIPARLLEEGFSFRHQELESCLTEIIKAK